MLECRARGWFVRTSLTDVYGLPPSANIATLAAALADASLIGGQSGVLDAAMRYGLPQVEFSAWEGENNREQLRDWEDAGWFAMSSDEEAAWMGDFRSKFQAGDDLFSPLCGMARWSSECLASRRCEIVVHVEEVATLGVLDSLRAIVPESSHIVALLHNYGAYRFLPHSGVRAAYRDYWAVPVLQSGHFHAFVTQYFEEGFVSVPVGPRRWDVQLYVFGSRLESLLTPVLTGVFGKPSRIGA